MARARNIKPGFFHNEDLVEVPFETRLLFIGLWTLADRRGRLEDRPKRIKMELFPVDDVDIDTSLNQLQDHGFILRYCVGDGRYIQVLAFNKHQNPHKTERESTIPAPDINGSATVNAPDKHDVNRAESLFTDSPNEESLSLGADAPAPPPEPAQKSGTRGTRLSRDFTVTDDMFAWATANGATPDLIASETEKFMDYWPAQPGARGVKLDWQATWRNWIRRATESPPPYAQRNGGSLTNHNKRGGYTAGELYEQSLREDVS
jgi:hypothetical protein